MSTQLELSESFVHNHMQRFSGLTINGDRQDQTHMNDEVWQWLRENVGKYRVHWQFLGDQKQRIWFLRDRDAMRFKLTWL